MNFITVFYYGILWVWFRTLSILADYLIAEKINIFYVSVLEIWGIVTYTTLIKTIPSQYLYAYTLFHAALFIILKTDFKALLISRFTTLYLVPIGWILSYYQHLPLSLTQSFTASIIAYGIFYAIKKIFYTIKKQDGLGQGDLDLIAFIGSFTGFAGCWFSVLIGSLIGTIVTLFSMLLNNHRSNIVAFGAYISIGCILYLLYKEQITLFFC